MRKTCKNNNFKVQERQGALLHPAKLEIAKAGELFYNMFLFDYVIAGITLVPLVLVLYLFGVVLLNETIFHYWFLFLNLTAVSNGLWIGKTINRSRRVFVY